MNEEVRATAHLARVLRGQHEGARALNGLMHDVLATAELVSIGRQGSSIDNALLVWVEVSGSLAAVAVDVDGPGSRSSSEPSGLLVEGIHLGLSGR